MNNTPTNQAGHDSMRVDLENFVAAKRTADFAENLVLPGVISNLQESLKTCDPLDMTEIVAAVNHLVLAQGRLRNVVNRTPSTPL